MSHALSSRAHGFAIRFFIFIINVALREINSASANLNNDNVSPTRENVYDLARIITPLSANAWRFNYFRRRYRKKSLPLVRVLLPSIVTSISAIRHDKFRRSSGKCTEATRT